MESQKKESLKIIPKEQGWASLKKMILLDLQDHFLSCLFHFLTPFESEYLL